MKTRKEMEEIINGGGSVLHSGRLITSLDKLPSEGELAKTDEEKAAVVDDYDAQIAELEKKRDALKPKKVANSGKESENGNSEETSDFPEGFPTRAKAVFEKLRTPYSEVKTMSRDALIKVNGIAAQLADDVLAFVENEGKE